MTARSTLKAAAVLAVLAMPVAGTAQAYAGDGGNDVLFRDRVMASTPQLDAPLVGAGRYVVVHLAENRVYVFDGDQAIWSAPAGTGTGFALASGDHQWKFSTPRGMMRVRRMEKDPLWEASDWHYVEKGLKPPPQNDPSRTMSGIMGSTAIYLGDGIAIHGTNQPQLLMNPDPDKRRVSHGCIRLTNENARELMHMVEVGTPVLIY
jgi:lipoprotein-anchoring transpeptidase ErfK/SrfK